MQHLHIGGAGVPLAIRSASAAVGLAATRSGVAISVDDFQTVVDQRASIRGLADDVEVFAARRWSFELAVVAVHDIIGPISPLKRRGMDIGGQSQAAGEEQALEHLDVLGE